MILSQHDYLYKLMVLLRSFNYLLKYLLNINTFNKCKLNK